MPRGSGFRWSVHQAGSLTCLGTRGRRLSSSYRKPVVNSQKCGGIKFYRVRLYLLIGSRDGDVNLARLTYTAAA